jgi:hypothetical protein
MNREIKFRCWDRTNKRFTYWSYENEGFNLAFCLNPNIGVDVSQYTGLKDKNRKEIYERDIMGDADDNQYTVSWVNAGFYLDEWCGGGISEDDFTDCEIIGNVYENPELITPPAENTAASETSASSETE